MFVPEHGELARLLTRSDVSSRRDKDLDAGPTPQVVKRFAELEEEYSDTLAVNHCAHGPS